MEKQTAIESYASKLHVAVIIWKELELKSNQVTKAINKQCGIINKVTDIVISAVK